MHSSYGHLYLQASNPAIAPMGEAKPNTEVFRLLAREMGFEPYLFEESDEELASRCSRENPESRPPGFGLPAEARSALTASPLMTPRPAQFDSIFPPTGHRLLKGNSPLLPANANSTPSAKNGPDAILCRTMSRRTKIRKRNPHWLRSILLQLLTPPAPQFLNSTFVNIDNLRKAAGERTLEIHPDDAVKRDIAEGQIVSVYNDRGRFRARAVIAQSVKPGVVVSLGLWWRKFTDDGANCNSTTATATTDLGGGATFFDNLVEVKAACGSGIS